VQALLMTRVKDLVLDLDDCTPEDMFSNFQTYIKMRQEWRDSVENGSTVQEVVSPLVVFEEAMKHSKMKAGWAASAELGNQRAEWIKDVAQATSFSQMLYQVKVLAWFIGRRQKARSSLKIASIFTGEMRLTRARAGISKPSRAAKEADERVELSSSDDDNDKMEEEEPEWNDKEGSDDENPRRSARSTRASTSGASGRSSRVASRSAQAPATRKSARATRSSKRTRGSEESESAADADSDGDDSDSSNNKTRRATRNTRQRVTRGAYTDLNSDSD